MREYSHLSGMSLGKRELQCLSLVAEGRTNQEIAVAMSTTKATIQSYMRRVLRKLGANDRAHAVYLALKSGVLDVNAIELGDGEAA
jgi:DNA-binding NarL/FixJ family response regulator